MMKANSVTAELWRIFMVFAGEWEKTSAEGAEAQVVTLTQARDLERC